MFLSKHKNGRWYVVYFKADGRRSAVSTGTNLKTEARKFLLRFQRKFREEADRQFVPINLKDFIFRYLKFSEPYFTEKTFKVYRTTFNFFFNYFGDVRLIDITTQQIEEYIHHRIKSSSIYAARKDFSNLSAAFNKAVRDKYLLTNPCKGIKRIRLPEQQPLFYTREEFTKLISAIEDPDLKDLTIFAVNTGLRQMELIKLHWDQIELDKKSIILSNRYHITKTKKVRTLPLNDTASRIILKRLKSKQEGSSNVFTFKGEEIDQGFLSREFKKFVLAAGINSKLNFHSLRHTFASWLVQQGVSIYVVSKLLGHSDIKTTQIYAHLRQEDLRNATNILSDAIQFEE